MKIVLVLEVTVSRKKSDAITIALFDVELSKMGFRDNVFWIKYNISREKICVTNRPALNVVREWLSIELLTCVR